jgi:hypothetical protein
MYKNSPEKIIFRDDSDNESFNSRFRTILKVGSATCILAIASLPFWSLNEKSDEKVANFIAKKVVPIVEEDSTRLPFCYSEQDFNDLRNNKNLFEQSDKDTVMDLKLTDDKSRISTVPNALPDYSDLVAGSTVQIKGNGITGSGFVTVNEKNERVIVTVAHAVSADINLTYIKSVDGKTFDVVDGCMIHAKSKGLPFQESVTNLTNPDENRKVVDYDVAVLRVDKPDELPNPLVLSNNLVKRGDVLYANNFQKTEVGKSALLDEITKQYTIVYKTGPGFISALDGLENRPPKNIEEMYVRDRTMGGASGGPVFDKNGSVVGVVYGAEDVKSYRNQSSLENNMGIIMSKEDAETIKPGTARYSDARIIEQALSSPAVND